MSAFSDDFKRTAKAAAVYTGTILGAGFASGQELIKFFVVHGRAGIYGIVSAGAVFAVCGWAVMDICARSRLKSPQEFIARVFGKKLGALVNAGTAAFTFVLLCAMISGAGALGAQCFGWSKLTGGVIMALSCFTIFLFDFRGIERVNLVLVPVMIGGGLFFSLYAYFNETSAAFAMIGGVREIVKSWGFAAVAYAAYNTITAISLLAGMPDVTQSRLAARRGGIIGGVSLAALGICFALPLYPNFQFIQRLEIPMLAIAARHGAAITAIYIAVLAAAILTTAAGNGFTVLGLLRGKINVRTGGGRLALSAGLLLCALLCARLDFSRFVGVVYPAFGILGAFEIAVIIMWFAFGKE